MARAKFVKLSWDEHKKITDKIASLTNSCDEANSERRRAYERLTADQTELGVLTKSLDQVSQQLASEQWKRADLQKLFDTLERNFIRLEAVVLSCADLVLPKLEEMLRPDGKLVG